MRARWESRVQQFDVAAWWKQTALLKEHHAATLAEPADQKALLSNPYEGRWCGRQLGESISAFLHRLPPSTTPTTPDVPWIYIANPHAAPAVVEGETDGATDDDSGRWAALATVGCAILEEFAAARADVERSLRDQPAATVARSVAGVRQACVERLLEAAQAGKCVTGKWMLFCNASEVDETWAAVATATAQNDLGIAAKVAADNGDDRSPRLVCVYTRDFADVEDVARVARQLKQMGLISGRGIYYKCDAYTHLDLAAGNAYGIKASLYSSADMLGRAPKMHTAPRADQTLDTYFRRK